MNPNYRAIFFDWDDTLGDWALASERAHRDLYDRYRWERFCSFDDWLRTYRAHNEHLWEDYAHGRITRDFLHIDQFRYPLSLFAVPENEYPQPDSALGDEYIQLTNRYFALRPDAHRVVTALAPHYPLTIVSNGYVETQYIKLRKSGLQSCFAHTVFSEEAGVAKPDPRIMLLALERNRNQLPNLQPSQVLMVGDSLTTDIAAAQAAGIDSAWLKPHNQPLNPPSPQPTYTLSSLSDLLNLL